MIYIGICQKEGMQVVSKCMEMLAVINYQENTNQNYDEILSYQS